MPKPIGSTFSRRAVAVGIAVSPLTLSGSASAQQPAPTPAAPPRVKGPRVWLDLDQKELDDAYDQSVYAPNIRTVLQRTARNSELVRDRIGAPKRFSYGPTEIEALDVFTAKTPNAPVHVFIHGGAWRGGLAKDYHYPAEMFVNAGANFVVPDFINVTQNGGDLLGMADQVRRSVAWAYKNAKSFGGDPDRFYISGHSSGGHWAGVLLTTDWQKDFGLPPTFIKGGCRGERHLRPQAGAALGAFELREVHRRSRGPAQRAASSRPARGAGGTRLRHRRDARIPAPVA